MNGRVIIMGSTGFAGTRLTHLIRTNDYPVPVEEISRNHSNPDNRIGDYADADDLRRLFGDLAIGQEDMVVFTAGMGNARECNDHPERAFLANTKGPATVAAACNRTGVHMVHLSTVAVQNGDKSDPYKETDIPEPRTVYGASKLAGEIKIQKILPEEDYSILRLTGLYGYNGEGKPNGLIKVLADAKGKDYRVNSEQESNPLFIDDLARVILALRDRIGTPGEPGVPGILNVGGPDPITRFDLARRISQNVLRPGERPNLIGISNAEDAPDRPRNQILDTSLLVSTLGARLTSVTEAVGQIRRQREGVLNTLEGKSGILEKR